MNKTWCLFACLCVLFSVCCCRPYTQDEYEESGSEVKDAVDERMHGPREGEPNPPLAPRAGRNRRSNLGDFNMACLKGCSYCSTKECRSACVNGCTQSSINYARLLGTANSWASDY